MSGSQAAAKEKALRFFLYFVQRGQSEGFLARFNRVKLGLDVPSSTCRTVQSTWRWEAGAMVNTRAMRNECIVQNLILSTSPFGLSNAVVSAPYV